MEYREALAALLEAKNRGFVLGLERIEMLCEEIGHPEKDLRFVHIAGTNGKGSVTAFLSSILCWSGLRTGTFSTPYLQRYTEQIRLDGEEIPERELALCAETVLKAADRIAQRGAGDPTEFELLTAVALLYFQKTGCEIVLMEVGMGGRLDATNVIPPPMLSIITRIRRDHMQFLGDSLESIAMEKAGILKEGTVLLTGEQTPEVLAFLKERAQALHIPFFEASQPESARILSPDRQTFRVDGRDYEIGLMGTYQTENAAIAVQAADILLERGLPVTERAIRKGLLSTKWPCRFERVYEHPDVVLDGAHNPDGVRALVHSILACYPGQKVVFLTGVLADKEYPEMMQMLLPYAKSFHTVTPPNPRALSAQDLKECLQSCQQERGEEIPVQAHDTYLEAARAAMGDAGENGVVIACGSLYLAGEVRKLYIES